MSVAQVMQMSTKDRMKLSSTIMRQSYWTQQTLAEMNFLQSDTPQRNHRQKRSIDEVQLQAEKTQPRIQMTLSKTGKLERENVPTQPRKTGNKKKTKVDNKQVTLFEKWDIPDNVDKVGNTAHGSRNKRQQKNTCTHKRYRGLRFDACRVCNTGGTLVECHSCRVVCHITCGKNMPDNVREQNVIWRCEECISEDGPTKCSYAIYSKKAEEQTSYIIKKKICEENQTNWEDVYSHSRNDTINGNETGLIGNIPEHIQMFILQTAKCRVVGVHPDGHCLRRALGKNHNLHPGQIIQYMRRKCDKLIKRKAKMKVESSDEWYETVKNRPVYWNDIKTNEPVTCTVEQWGGINEIQLWAMIIQRTVIVLDRTYNVATLYKPSGDELPKKIDMKNIAKVHHNLNRNGKRPEYLLYNGINHYNGISRQNPTVMELYKGMNHYNGTKSVSRPRTREARSGSESSRTKTTRKRDNEETETHYKCVGKDEQVKCKQHRAHFVHSGQIGKGTLRQRLASLARGRQNKPKKRRIAEKQTTKSSLRSLETERITEIPTEEKSNGQKRQNDEDKEEQNKKKKRMINSEMKQVEEKLLLDVSNREFKKRKQMNTEERDKEERRTKWKSHDK